MSSNQYPEDEFDLQGRTIPVGMHRKPTPKWRLYLPFVVVLILAPLSAWGVVYVMDRTDTTSSLVTDTSTSSTSSSTTTDAQKQAAAKKKAEEEAKKQAEEQAKAQAEEEAKKQAEEQAQKEAEAQQVNHDLKVKVFNATTTTGLAGRVAEKLRAQSFSDVSAGNSPGVNQSVSTVYYGSEDAKATAQAIATQLGIQNVVMDSSVPGGDGVAVLLQTDYNAN